jgi:hypothetical protein
MLRAHRLVTPGTLLALDRGGLAEPALFLGATKPVDEVGVDLLQPRSSDRGNPE